MIENLVNDKNIKNFKNALSKLAGFFDENPKIGGEFTEKFIVESFNNINIKSEKIIGRKKADITINDVEYSIKSSAGKGSQIDTLSEGKITIESLIKLDNKSLVNTEKYKVLLNNKNKILNKICESIEKMPIIFFNCGIKNDVASFRISEVSYDELTDYIKSVDSVYYERPKNRNKITLVKNNKELFEIKDGTGMAAANAFQRGIWSKDLSFLKNYKYFEHVKIKRLNFYDN